MIGDLAKAVDTMLKHPFGNIIGAGVVLLVLFFFFEQYTDRFSMARLDSAATLLQKTADSPAKAELSAYVQQETGRILLQHPDDHWALRMFGAWIPFLCVASLWWRSQKLGVLQICLVGAMASAAIAALPDFFPSAWDSMAVSVCIIMILGAVALHGLIVPGGRRDVS